MNDIFLRYTLRVNKQLFGKFRYIAEYEGRSANKEIEQMMRKRVEKFENMHGDIKLDEKDEET